MSAGLFGNIIAYLVSWILPSTNPAEQYEKWRAEASIRGKEMAQHYEESNRAYASGQKKLAKELSERAGVCRGEMEALNERASAWIYSENNRDRPAGEIDLHNLYVKEALRYTARAIEEARRDGRTHVRLIVGQGRHSLNGVAKIWPAIVDLMTRYELVAEQDPRNAGVLVISVGGRGRQTAPVGESVLGVDDILGQNQDGRGCLIM